MSTRMSTALAAFWLLFVSAPTSCLAQDAVTQRFAYCWVEDPSGREVWVSTVFPAPPGNDFLLKAVLAEFEAQVATLGGSGTLNRCPLAGVSREAAEQSRAQSAAIMGRRVFGRHLYRWHDVSWAPNAAAYATPAPAPTAPASTGATSAGTVPKAPSAAASATASDDVEAEFWRRIASSQQAEDFEDYLAAYPQGRHAPLARLEAKRLRRGSSGASATEPAPAATPALTPPTAPAAAIAANDPAADAQLSAELRQQLASTAFFRLPPAADATPVQRSGHQTGAGGIPLELTVRVGRIASSNLCQDDETIAVGGQFASRTESHGLTWAGLIPLTLQSTSIGATGQALYSYTMSPPQLEQLLGQPLPLVAGAQFSYTQSFDLAHGDGAQSHHTQNWQCQIGATGAGLAGEQTEALCRMQEGDFVKDFAFHWYPTAGCFVRDPSR